MKTKNKQNAPEEESLLSSVLSMDEILDLIGPYMKVRQVYTLDEVIHLLPEAKDRTAVRFSAMKLQGTFVKIFGNIQYKKPDPNYPNQ